MVSISSDGFVAWLSVFPDTCFLSMSVIMYRARKLKELYNQNSDLVNA